MTLYTAGVIYAYVLNVRRICTQLLCSNTPIYSVVINILAKFYHVKHFNICFKANLLSSFQVVRVCSVLCFSRFTWQLTQRLRHSINAISHYSMQWNA